MNDDQNTTQDEEVNAPEIQEEDSNAQEKSTGISQQPTDDSDVIPSGSEESLVLETESGDPSSQAPQDDKKQAPLNDEEATEATESQEESKESEESKGTEEKVEDEEEKAPENPNAVNGKWYVVHTFAGHENRVATTLKQRIEAEHLENVIFDILVPTQDKIEIRGGKKETVKEKIFPGYILVKMILDDTSWLAVRTTQGVTSFVGAGNKPTPISEAEVNTIVKFTTQGAQPTFKDVFMVDDTVKIVDGPFSEFIGKVDSVDKEKGRVRVLVSIFGRETPVELDFLQVQKL